MKKYGLLLRAPPTQHREPSRPQLAPSLSTFFGDDDDGVETEIARHATKNKSLRDVEELHKKALEEDPSVFDYDGVYDEMKEKIARPHEQDVQERKPKYIQLLIEKAKEREREHEIIYERKLAKERSEDDHLYADKDKFVTSAYKKKLAEQAKWLEEERIRQLREEKEDVTKKSDLSDFYFNLSRNVALGGEGKSSRNPRKQESKVTDGTHEMEDLMASKGPSSSPVGTDINQSESSKKIESHIISSDIKSVSDETSVQESSTTEQQMADQAMQIRHKRSEDALVAAKERYLARKRAREQ